jgi:hypothetical protein
MRKLEALLRRFTRLARCAGPVIATAALLMPIAGPVRAFVATAGQDIQKSAKSNEWYGEVRYYNSDDTITIAKSATSEVKYDLADKKITYKIDPSVKTGSKVRVLEQELGDGKRLVSITPRSQ